MSSMITTLAATIAFTITGIQYSYTAYKYIYYPLFGGPSTGGIQIVVPVADLFGKDKKSKVIQDEFDGMKADFKALEKILLENHFRKSSVKVKLKRRHSLPHNMHFKSSLL